MHVVELERGEDHQIRWLFDLAALRIDIGHAGGAFFIVGEIDAQHVRVVAQLEFRLLTQRRPDIDVRRRFGIHVAGVAAAIAAEVAWAHLRAIGVGVGARGVGRRQIVGMIAHRLGRLREQLRGVSALLRRQREIVRAIRRKRVAPALTDDFAFNAPRGAGGAEHLFSLVEERLQLVVSDAEILNGHAFRDKVFAVALLIVAAHPQLCRIDAKMDAGPVQACAAGAGTRQKRRQLTIGLCGLRDVVTNGDGAFRQILEQLFADVIGQLIDHLRIRAVRVGIAMRTALQRHHVQARFRQLFRHNGTGPAEADNHRVHFIHYVCHAYALSPRIDTAGKG